MRKGLGLVVVGLFGCSPTGPSPTGPISADEKPAVSPSQPKPGGTAAPSAEAAPVPDAKASATVVHMTAATLADDCGGGPNTRPKEQKANKAKRKRKGARAQGARARRRCEQSSIQLSVTAPADAAAAEMAVTSVELLLESGKSLGKLETRVPSVWSDADGYKPWNERVEPGQDLSVTYALTQPDWSQVEDRWNQTYTVKAVISIAGSDQTVEQNVVVDAPTSLPPNVRT